MKEFCEKIPDEVLEKINTPAYPYIAEKELDNLFQTHFPYLDFKKQKKEKK